MPLTVPSPFSLDSLTRPGGIEKTISAPVAATAASTQWDRFTLLCVLLGESSPAVRDPKAAVRVGRHLEPRGGSHVIRRRGLSVGSLRGQASWLEVGNERLGSVVVARRDRVMVLPQIHEARRLLENLKRLRRPTLRRAVVHHGNPRLQRVD